ncbi:DDB1- and CUL4-associated factor 5 [Asbolus verrucosus]|uniref:DDB1-and CUL4-associated factor 5 n=1 Tax=Asbolus verrucosus TaxID=1661398 RepID=A0A482W9T3_ASBVE|nr:DDB1- and CUL4-associated factor 5 [Asbolus verrucosus]
MAKPSPLNPLRHIIERQYKDNVFIKNKIFKERLAKARNLYRKDLLAHYGCVNAIEFSGEGDLLVSGGDDRRVLLWSVPEAMYGKGSPVVMETNHISNIFCLAFDSGNTKIFSGGNDDQVIIHDAITYHLKEKNRKKKGSQKFKTSSKFKKNNGTNKKSTSSSKHVALEKDNHKHKFVPERSKLRKYRTRQSLRETCDSGASNNSFDAPSTSTGITSSNNSVFRVIEQDSDEDVPPNNCTENGGSEENNFVNILPTPLNGTHDIESDTDYEFDYRTPVKKRRTVSASDSGCGTGPCSSTSPYPIRNSRNHQECSSNDLYNNGRDSEEEFNYEKFKKRVNKARMNIRKQIGVDSDSN